MDDFTRPVMSSQSDEEVILASSRPKKRAGRRVFKETRHPVFRGVRQRNNGKWVCEVREPGTQTRIWLGTYPTPEMAARAHDVAAMALRGRSTCLNFADSAWRLQVPASTDSKDIRAAAAEAAEMFRPCMDGGASASGVTEAGAGNQVFYMDDKAGAPGLMADLAEGLLLPPPPSDYVDTDYVEYYDDVSLWSYSI